MTLYIIGIGLENEKDVSIKGLEAIKSSSEIYLENYTSILQVSKEQLEKFYKKKIIVEGKKDKRALENLGCKKVIQINGKVNGANPGLFNIIDKLPTNCREAVILTDLDKKGKQLYHRLKTILTKNRIKVDDRFRIFLFKETKIRQIEGLKINIQNQQN